MCRFTDVNACLPVYRKEGERRLVSWRLPCFFEEGFQHFFYDGCVWLHHIRQGFLDGLFPKSVKIDASHFIEKDCFGREYIFPVIEGCYIQGLLIRNQDNLSVCVVTVLPELRNGCFKRWPKLVYALEKIQRY